MSTFSDIGIDPIEGAEIYEVVGIYDHDFSDPRRFSMIKDIVSFLKGKQNKRFLVNRIMKPGVNRIEHLWTYIQLKKEMGDKVDGLKGFAAEFTEDVQKEMNSGYLSGEAIAKMEKQVGNMAIQIDQQKKAFLKQTEELKKKQAEVAAREQEQETKAIKIKLTLSKIDKLKEELKAYE